MISNDMMFFHSCHVVHSGFLFSGAILSGKLILKYANMRYSGLLGRGPVHNGIIMGVRMGIHSGGGSKNTLASDL